jgi:mono/diheme cytochrome c family protein
MRKITITFSMLAFILVVACGSQRFSDGEALFNRHCAQCHMENGSGLGEAIPALTAERLEVIWDEIACQIRYGKQGEMMAMPSNSDLNDVEINNILNYLSTKFSDGSRSFAFPETAEQLKSCAEK